METSLHVKNVKVRYKLTCGLQSWVDFDTERFENSFATAVIAVGFFEIPVYFQEMCKHRET